MVLHPFLIAIYPIVALLGANINEIPIEETLRSILFSIGFALITMLLFWLIFRNWQKAGLLSSLSILLLFSYGHVYNLIKGLDVFGFIIGRHRFQIVIWAVLFLVASYIVGSRLRESSSLTKGFNIIALASLIIPVFTITRNEFLSRQTVQVSDVASGLNSQRSSASLEQLPDIYYIILDAYAREDVLREYYEFDNSGFTESLEALGFYVADRSNTNYLYSALSIGSALNMQYVQDFNVDFDRVVYPEFMLEPTRHSLVRQKFEEYGYEIVNLPSGYPATTFEDADYFLTPEMKTFEILQEGGVLNEFEGMLLNTTIVRVLLDLQTSREANWFAEQLEYPYHLHRIRILSAFGNLKTIPLIKGPKFVFAHIILPHRPYTFGPNGEWLEPSGVFSFKEIHNLQTSDWGSAYLAQLTYASSMIQETLATILERSNQTPIIILQSDHGPDFGLDWDDPENTPQELLYRAAILNAYYMPAECVDDVYSSVSPVNSFRIVFNCVFDESNSMLEDVTYFNNIRYSSLAEPWNFTPVDELIVAKPHPMDTE